jgi:anti-sigma B factor antagonist
MVRLQSEMILATLGGLYHCDTGVSTRSSGLFRRGGAVDLSVLRQSDVQILRLRGRLTLGQPVDSFRQALEQGFESGDTRFLVNLAEVPMVDSSGIGVLVRCHTNARQKGGNIKLVQPQSYTVKTLKMVGLLDLFEVFETEEDGVASFAK